MWLVRGTPALVLYRGALDPRDRRALALWSSTQLPLVLAITALETTGGHMGPAVAADLVGAALLSTLAFPMLGLRMRRSAPDDAMASAGSAAAAIGDVERLPGSVPVGLDGSSAER
jgi:hypothetical protein